MKTFEEIVKQEPVYINEWNDEKGVLYDFFEDDYVYDSDKGDYVKRNNRHLAEDVNIMFASYGYENYSGDAFVLFESEGKIYEVNGSHCSCYGLEGQWSPDEVLLAELEHRLTVGTFGEDDYAGNEFKNELCDFLGIPFTVNGLQW